MRVVKWTGKSRGGILAAARRRKGSLSEWAQMSGLRAVLLVATHLATIMLTACGGGSTILPQDRTPPPVTGVIVSPTSALADQGATIQFSASVLGSSNQAVAWSIQEAGGGSISQTGLYTVPAAAMEVHVTATSVADPSKSATSLVTVRAVSISMPLTTAVPRGRQRQFTAVVAGTVVTGVTWSVDEGAAGGTITVDGLYTAPMSGGPFHVTARSVADSSKSVTAAVFLADAGFRLLSSSLLEPRIAPTVTLLPNGKVLIAGGSWCRSSACNGWDPLETAELFDPVTETFSATGSMSTGRTGHTATLLNNGTVLVTGGLNPQLAGNTTAEIYDPATGNFTLVGNMAEGRLWPTASLLGDGRVLIAGGSLGLGPLLKTAEIYDPAAQIFSAAGDMPKETAIHTASVLLDGTVLVVGGDGSSSSCPNGAPGLAIFDPASNSFNASVSLPERRAGHTATTLNDGRVLITGGWDSCDFEDFPAAYGTAVVFDPATSSFSAPLMMREPRSVHTATLLADGKVLVVGSIAELFDPATGNFVITGDPNVPGGGGRATRLADGRVLFIGLGFLASAAQIYE
ncbi:MAG: Ig-like domain-containing protein [Acidobacteria bacterium]|nr:Ig-like domain-containing protein [Acidobacteriota bacterium]